VLDGAVYNRQWQAVWSGRTAVTDTGWTAELTIPWVALRYAVGTTRMRVNFHRSARRENEYSGWVAWPRSQNAYRMDFAGWLAASRRRRQPAPSGRARTAPPRPSTPMTRARRPPTSAAR